MLGSSGAVAGELLRSDAVAALALLVLGLATAALLDQARRRFWDRWWLRVAIVVLVLGILGPALGRLDVLMVLAGVTWMQGLGARAALPFRTSWFRWVDALPAVLLVQVLWVWSGGGAMAPLLATVAAVVLTGDRRTDAGPADPLGRIAGSARRSRVRLASWCASARTTAMTWPTWVDYVGGGLAAGALMVPFFYSLATERSVVLPRELGFYNDFPAHIEVAGNLGVDPLVLPPHPLFHLLTRLGMQLVTPAWAASLALGLFVAISFGGLVLLARRHPPGGVPLGRGWSLLFAGALLAAASPAVLLIRAGLLDPLTNLAPVHTWNSPTETVGVAGVLLLLPVLLDAIDAPEPLSRRRRTILLAASVAAVIAKPSFSLALIPALPMLLWRRDRCTGPNTRALLSNVVLPSFIVVSLQTILLLALAPPEYSGGLVVRPLAVIDRFGVGNSGPVFFLGPAIVLVALLLGGRRYVRDTGVQLGWTALLFSMVPALLLDETGPLAGDGNVAKPSLICWAVVYVCTARFLASEVVLRRRRWRDEPASSRVALSGLALYAAATVAAGASAWLLAVSRI
jgi:hypothetical protein